MACRKTDVPFVCSGRWWALAGRNRGSDDVQEGIWDQGRRRLDVTNIRLMAVRLFGEVVGVGGWESRRR
jgi:hypothetical protein